jgi:hypothetical protein
MWREIGDSRAAVFGQLKKPASSGQSHVIVLDKKIDVWENKVVYYISCLKGAFNARETTNDFGAFFYPD